MNNTSPGSKHSIPQASDQATSLANSLSNVNIGKSKETESRQAENKIQKVSTSSGQLIQFDWQTFHTGTRAISNGWRWFGRVSRKTERTKEITNEIRVNAQVYLEFPMEGW